MNEQFLTQADYDIRCEWGTHGVEILAPLCSAIVIVDILSFTTCVTIAVNRGATIIPWIDDHGSASEFAASSSASTAGTRSVSHPSLSPRSWENVVCGERFVLPSLNGATLSKLTGATKTVAGSFLNAKAVGQYLSTIKPPIGVIPAGERWSDGGLRPALEDWLGAGAIIRAVHGTKSPEAKAAQVAFASMETELFNAIASSASGVELQQIGFGEDIEIACQCDVTETVPILNDGEYSAGTSRASIPK